MKQLRPPIVTVLGHVDHGKTSILDALRGTNLQSRESGGITQGTSISTIETSSKEKITFIDTPGHALFSKMRERGSKIADIALLVVAADDGVKPQTVEALNFIKMTKIPYIVVFNKIDLASADVPLVQGELMEREVLFEGLGGDVPFIQVSAKKKEGLTALIELINLVSAVNEISGDPEGELLGFVVESNRDKRGDVASVVVKNGSLKIGDHIYCDGRELKVKGLFNNTGSNVKEILPGFGGVVLGFCEMPEVGSKITSVNNKSEKSQAVAENNIKVLEGQIGIILKASSAGKLEAIKNALPNDVKVLFSGVGEPCDSDIFMAKSGDGEVVCFELKISGGIQKLADTEDVKVTNFTIIYKLIEYLEQLISDKKRKFSGKAEIMAKFPFNNSFVAGCKILEGKMTSSDQLMLIRGDLELGRARVKSLRRGKEEIAEAKAGEECGILISPQLDFNVGDVLLSATK